MILRYDPQQDCYWCPANEKLTYRFQTTEKDREIKYYATSAYAQCAIRAQCTRNKGGRRITRSKAGAASPAGWTRTCWMRWSDEF